MEINFHKIYHKVFLYINILIYIYKIYFYVLSVVKYNTSTPNSSSASVKLTTN